MARLRQFRFTTLLRIRRRQEDARAQELAVARRHVDVATGQREAILGEQRRAMARAGTLTKVAFDASDVRRYYQYERHLARLGDEKDAEIHELEEKAEEKRSALLSASQSKQIVERLEERHRKAKAAALRKDEQRQSDEIATNYAALNPRRSRLEGGEGI